jgi:hypothetical protein
LREFRRIVRKPMSLRNDIKYVLTTLGEAFRQILGTTFRTLADYLLQDSKDGPRAPEEPKPPTSVASQDLPEVELEAKPSKPRDRSKYNPKEHGQYKIAAIGVLKTLLSMPPGFRASAPALAKMLPNSTDSTIRTACKTMVTDGLFETTFDDSIRSCVYWVYNVKAATLYLSELESTTPALPVSDEARESETSLN